MGQPISRNTDEETRHGSRAASSELPTMGPKRSTRTTDSPAARATGNQVQYLIAWVELFGSGEFEGWQTMMSFLGFEEEFTSKTQCRKALKYTWVNIIDFLVSVKTDGEPYFFANQRQLGRYTLSTRKFFPKRLIPKGSPLRILFASINT
ncbi:uncharacterized protein F4812DRAFT_65747 [Daldinia caldariorum]|uniref:uncharacterized protein n=1 Tax=Daldinia caldariorum TaxID=326644 RepID=UPI00200737D3|nr:uncharacterized protein F4812DRAFT_65747 [Daldinia caldariorum]KAI1466778.1 hypothetical protein F4812DRAFT_65747 [Daldinia caldariorum]